MSETFISARWLLVGLLGLSLWLAPAAAYGRSRNLRDALNKFSTLHSQGQYEQALPFAKQAAKLVEKEFGANHPAFATAINNLAEIYRELGRYAEAEPLYKQALAIVEKTQGARHPNMATSLNNLMACTAAAWGWK